MNKAKKTVATLLSMLLCVCFPVTVSAETVRLKEYDFSFELPEEYIQLTAKNAEDYADLLEPLGYDEAAFTSYLSKNGILLFALTEEGAQLTLKSWETDFSKQAVDFDELSDEKLESVARQLLPEQTADFTLIRGGGPDMICATSTLKDSGGTFTSVQYIFLRNKRFFALNFTFPGENNSQNTELAESVAESVQLKNKYAKGYWNFTTVLETVLIWSVIAAVVVVIGALIRSFILDRKRASQDEAVEEIYIQRRKK